MTFASLKTAYLFLEGYGIEKADASETATDSGVHP
jgi:hypothetical protein